VLFADFIRTAARAAIVLPVQLSSCGWKIEMVAPW